MLLLIPGPVQTRPEIRAVMAEDIAPWDDDFRAEYAAMKRDLWEAVQDGRFALPIDRVFALDDVVEALAHMKANRHFGKIALSI